MPIGKTLNFKVMKIYRQCVGVDISKDKFDCSLGLINDNREVREIGSRVFRNNEKGILGFVDWLSSSVLPNLRVIIVMEATGVYYENLAYYLTEHTDHKVCVLLPMRAKYYFKSLETKTKTDKVDARMLSQLGLERNVPSWEPLSSKMRVMKHLSREYRDNKREINRLKNQLHAKEHGYKVGFQIIRRLKQKIELVENQCLSIEFELKEMVREDVFLSEKLDKLTSIPGLRFMSIVTIVAETNGFILIRNAKQLSSYAGLDVVHNSSGKKTGKSRISKRGNKYIRQALYMPALSASKHVNELASFYSRVNEKNNCKKIGLIGVARKLLTLIYTLWKKDEYYRIVTN